MNTPLPGFENEPSRFRYEPQNLEEALSFASTVVKSGLAPHIQCAEQAFVIIVTGAELGLTAMQAIRSIYIIDGKPTLSADLIAALVKRSPICLWFRLIETNNDSATYETHRRNEPEPTRYVFTLEDARRAGLLKRRLWREYPAAMLRARCITALARIVYPDLMAGVYDPDELQAQSPPRRQTPNSGPSTDTPKTASSAPRPAPAKAETKTTEAKPKVEKEVPPLTPPAPTPKAPAGEAQIEVAEEIESNSAVSEVSAVSEEPAAEALVVSEEPTVEAEVPLVSEEPAVEVEVLLVPEEPAVEVEVPLVPEEPAVEVEAPLVSEEPAVEVEAPLVSEEPAVEVEAPLVSEEPAVEVEAPLVSEEPAVEVEVPKGEAAVPVSLSVEVAPEEPVNTLLVEALPVVEAAPEDEDGLLLLSLDEKIGTLREIKDRKLAARTAAQHLIKTGAYETEGEAIKVLVSAVQEIGILPTDASIEDLARAWQTVESRLFD